MFKTGSNLDGRGGLIELQERRALRVVRTRSLAACGTIGDGGASSNMTIVARPIACGRPWWHQVVCLAASISAGLTLVWAALATPARAADPAVVFMAQV